MEIKNINNEKGNWSVEVDGNTIKVENKTTTRLLINDKLQDVIPDISFGALMTGKLPDGRKVKVRLGGGFRIHCYIFVDNEIVLED